MEHRPPQNFLLPTFTPLGSAGARASEIHRMIGLSKFFDEFTLEDIKKLSSFMTLYQIPAGRLIIREGDRDDYMLFILEGHVNIMKTDTFGADRPMAVAGPGVTLGEMSMIDGEPRFASCVALEATTFAVLTRGNMVNIILDEPRLGSKILIKLVNLMSQRLRKTSTELLRHMENSHTETI